MDRGPLGITHVPPSIQSKVPVEYYTFSFYGVYQHTLDNQGLEAFLKDDLCISVQGRLCRSDSAICLESEELAKQYKELKLPQWREKWGPGTQVRINWCSSSSRRTFFKVLEHSDTVKRRLGLWE